MNILTGDEMKTVEDFYYRIGAYDMVISEDKIWCCGNKQNTLYEIGRDTHTIKALAEFDESEIHKDKMYRSLIHINNKLVLIPFSADKIGIYDLNANQLEYEEINMHWADRSDQMWKNKKFRKAFSYGNKVYLLGYHYPAIIQYDIAQRTLKYHTDWLDLLEIEKPDYRGYINDYILKENQVYLFMGSCPLILKINIDTWKTETIKVNTSLKGFGGAVSDGGNFWTVGRGSTNNKLLKINPKTWQTKELDILLDEEKKLENPFYEPLVTEKNIYLFPMRSQHVYKLDRETEKCEVEEAFDKLFTDDRNMFCSYYGLPPRQIGKKILFVTGTDFIWHEFEMDDRKIESYEMRMPNNDVFLNKKIIGKIDKRIKEIISENLGISLKNFLEYIEVGNG